MLSFFPIFISIGAILPYFRIDPADILPYLGSFIPQPILELIQPYIRTYLTQPRGGLLSFGILATIWSASTGMGFVQRGIDHIYGIPNTRRMITSRLFSIVIFLSLIFLLVVLMLALPFGEPIMQSILSFLQLDATAALRGFEILTIALSFLVMFLFFMLIYRVSPNVKQRLRDAVPGAFFSTVLLSALVQLYAVYLRIASHTLSAYGILSAFFVLMVWLQLLACVILVGAVLNAVLFERKHGEIVGRTGRIDRLITQSFDRFSKRIRKKKQPEQKENTNGAPQ